MKGFDEKELAFVNDPSQWPMKEWGHSICCLKLRAPLRNTRASIRGAFGSQFGCLYDVLGWKVIRHDGVAEDFTSAEEMLKVWTVD